MTNASLLGKIVERFYIVYNKAMKKENPTAQGKVGYKKPPVNRQFGKPGGNPRNNNGIPKYVREIRAELKELLDPNLSIEDYEKIVKDAKTDSGLRGVFATAILKKDYRTIIQLIDQAWGKPKESVDITTGGEPMTALVKFVDGTSRD